MYQDQPPRQPCCKSSVAIATTASRLAAAHRQAMHILLFMLLFLAAFLLGARIAMAEDAASTNSSINDDFTLFVLIENDKFGGGTDQHYSNGLSFTLVSPDVESLKEGSIPDWVKAYDDFLYHWRDKLKKQSISYTVGHTIYTPIDVKTEDFVDNDRPYAGWLYFSLGLHSKDEEVLDIFETTIGMVGPSGLGEQVQNNFHNFIGVDRSEGWHHQLKDEPGLMLTWQQNRRYLADYDGTDFGIDFIPHLGATLGNVLTHANAGAEVRLGWNLPDNFGSSLIGPARGVAAPSTDTDSQGFGMHVFAGTNVRAVGRNIFLDGNTWQNSPSVAKKWLVGDIFAGASVHNNGFAVTYTQAARSAEFYGQEEHHVFGSLMFSLAF